MRTKKIYRLLPVQVPYFWEAIKFAVAKTEEINKEDLPFFYGQLLQHLLSDKAQCFVVLDDKRILISIAVTAILVNKITGATELYVNTLYAMETSSPKDYMEYYQFIKEFAVNRGCKRVVFNSRNPKVWEMAKYFECTERYRTFESSL